MCGKRTIAKNLSASGPELAWVIFSEKKVMIDPNADKLCPTCSGKEEGKELCPWETVESLPADWIDERTDVKSPEESNRLVQTLCALMASGLLRKMVKRALKPKTKKLSPNTIPVKKCIALGNVPQHKMRRIAIRTLKNMHRCTDETYEQVVAKIEAMPKNDDVLCDELIRTRPRTNVKLRPYEIDTE